MIAVQSFESGIQCANCKVWRWCDVLIWEREDGSLWSCMPWVYVQSEDIWGKLNQRRQHHSWLPSIHWLVPTAVVQLWCFVIGAFFHRCDHHRAGTSVQCAAQNPSLACGLQHLRVFSYYVSTIRSCVGERNWNKYWQRSWINGILSGKIG